MNEKQPSAKKTVVSAEGMKKLEEQLQYLTTTRRAEVAEQISTARGFGDLSENAEYDEAKNEQSMLEAQILDLENTIRTAIVIEDSEIKTDKVNIGTTVTVLDMELDEKIEYTIVGARESEPAKYKISNDSPIGAALLGHRRNEVVTANTPGGEVNMKILRIRRQSSK